MFNPTKAHTKEISQGQLKIRMGGRVPTNAVNLAYSYVTPLNPEENVQIADTSGFILENVASEKAVDILLWPDETYLLRNADGEPEVYSQTFLVTNIFSGTEPLYYSQRLKYRHYDKQGPDANGFYQGKSIVVTDSSGVKLNGEYKSQILLYPSGEANLYYIDVFTNFQTKPGEEYRVLYNAMTPDGMKTGFVEPLNAQPAFARKKELEQVSVPGLEREAIYYKAMSADFGYSQVYVSQRQVGLIKPTYAVRPLDNAQIRVLAPIAKDASENWFLRVKNGRFYRGVLNAQNLPEGYGYFVPEYYRQPFDEQYGLPYRKVSAEKPQIISERQIKVRYTPLFVVANRNTGIVENVTVNVNKIPMAVKSWDAYTGIIELDGNVRDNDDIKVDYFFQETTYEYRGFWDETNQRFWYLDLNPGKGHISTIYNADGDELQDVSSLALINKTIYLYLRPTGKMTNIVDVVGERMQLDVGGIYTLQREALSVFRPKIYLRFAGTEVKHVDDAIPGETSWEFVEEGYLYQRIQINSPAAPVGDAYAIDYSYVSSKYNFVSGTFSGSTLFHSFEELDEPNAILLGKIQVRPNSSRDSVKLIDTRTRGGGLKETIGRQIINELMPEGASYWDIGYWDGEPYQENAVIIIKLPRYILKEFGGNLTKQEVEASVEKYLAYGVFYIIEYLEESIALLETPQHFVVEVKDIIIPDKTPLPVPQFTLITEG